MNKWLRVIGIGEDGWDDLADDTRALLYESKTVLGGERHLKMIPDDWEGERIVWPSPIREAVSKIVSWRADSSEKDRNQETSLPVVIKASGDPDSYTHLRAPET